MPGTALLELDPKKIRIDSNVRSKVGDLAGLTASVKRHGVLVPLLVKSDGNGGHVLVAGQRRLKSAIAAKLETVPCRETSGDDQAMVEQQLIENLQRVDLTEADEAKGFEQLRVFGLDEITIAEITGRDVKHVERGLQVAASKTATTIAAKHDLTIEEAAAIAEFEDDREAVKTLTVTAVDRPESFPHILSRLRQQRADEKKLDVVRKRLTKAGIKIVDQPQYDSPLTQPCRLDTLVDDKGKNLTNANHKKCPGHAIAVVKDWDGIREMGVCIDPKGNGHKKQTRSGSSQSSNQPSLEERRKMLDENKQWRAAEPVRRAFIVDLLARATPPRGTLKFVTLEIMGDPDSLGGKMGGQNEKLLGEFLGVKAGKDGYRYNRHIGLAAATRATETRAPLVLLAQIAADREQMMDHTTPRTKSPSSARWMAFLAKCGYHLSDIEKKVK